MRGASKGEAPANLAAWIDGEVGAGIQPRYGNLPGEVKREVVEKLRSEQTGLCVYCGRELSVALQEYHIEHFRPQHPYQDLEVEYPNLFLSCGPQGGNRRVIATCGRAKDNWFDEGEHVYPSPETCSNFFVFMASGKILDNESPAAARMIDVLRLEDDELKAERRDLIEELDEVISNGESVGSLLASWRELDANGNRGSFANVAIRYLEDY